MTPEWEIWAPLLLLASLLGGWFLFQSQGPERRLSKATARFPALRASYGPFPVIVLSRSALVRALTPLAHRQSGFLFISADTISLVTPSGAEWEKSDFSRQEAEVVFIDNRGIASGLPSLLRFSSPRGNAYVAASTPLGRAKDDATEALYGRVMDRFPTQPFPEPARASAKRDRVILALIGVLLASAAGAALWASSGMHALDGPTDMLELPDRSVLLASRTHLYRLSASGDAVETIALRHLGFDDGVSGLQQIGDEDVLIGDYAEKTIKRCRVDGWQCKRLSGFGDRGPFLDAFSFVVDRKRARIYASDIARHRLMELDEDGQMIRRLRLDRELCFPNELIVNADGFTVVNTNLHKLQRFRWSDDGRSLSSAGEWLTVRQGRERVNCPDPNEAFFVRFFHRERGSGSPARAFNIATPGRVWPMRAVQMKDGSMWVLNARNGMAMADVVRFAPGMTRPSLVLSGVNHDPIALLARADDVLVSDLEGPAILRFSHSGEPKGMFGGPAFVEQMQMIHRAGERRRDLHRVGLVGLVVVLLLAVSFQIWQLRRRVRWVIAQEPTF